MAAVAGAHPPRRGHDLGDRQRAARLPHRPVPDHGARHQRQDALGRAADQRRRPVRDRRRRFGARSTCSSWSRRTTCAGTASASSSPSPSSFEQYATLDRQQAGPGARRHARPGHRHVPRREQVAGPPRRPDRQPRQPLLPRAVLGAGAGRADRRRRSSRRRSPALAETLAENEEQIAGELLAVQGSPVDIGGYYRPDPEKTVGGDAPVGDVQRGARPAVAGRVTPVRSTPSSPAASPTAACPRTTPRRSAARRPCRRARRP